MAVCQNYGDITQVQTAIEENAIAEGVKHGLVLQNVKRSTSHPAEMSLGALSFAPLAAAASGDVCVENGCSEV